MKHLYIIGNGFDQHHQMKCGYLSFKTWLEKNDSSLLLDIEEYYGDVDDDWWSNFEASLSELSDVDSYVQNIVQDNYPNFGSDDFRDADWYDAEVAVENDLKELANRIKTTFHKWIKSLPKPNPKCKVILQTSDSFFISFNYTDTLESLYGIPEMNILYIHGKANRDRELILGHGKTLDEIRKDIIPEEPTIPEGLSDEEYAEYELELSENYDFVTDRAYESAAAQIVSLKKNVELICQNNSELFLTFKDVSFVHIYGSSFSDIDLPYLERIFSNIKKEFKIEASYYDPGDDVHFRHQLNKIGIPDKRISIIKLQEILEDPV